MLRRSVPAIYSRARLLGLRSPDGASRAGRIGARHPKSIATRFQKGHVPSNKGERMRADVYEKVARTMFRHIGHTLGFRVHPHLIRKTMATQAMMRGMPIDEVRIMLGHESIATTTIYAQTLKDNIKESHTKYL